MAETRGMIQMRASMRSVFVAVIATVIAAGPLHAQILQGEFATPEAELRALFMAVTDAEPSAVLDQLFDLYAPATIFPETQPSNGLEWVHYDGRYTNSSEPDFVWGHVAWRLDRQGAEVTIVAGFSIAERNTVGTMTISRVAPQIRDAIRIEVQLRTEWSEQNTIIPQLRASSRLAINPTPIEGTVDPLDRIVADFPAAMLFVVSDAVGFETRPVTGRYASIMLSLGATGRAVFDEAMAAWGIAPAE